MKFTKKDISSLKYYYDRIKNRMEISNIYESNNKKPIPEFIKINLIKYGIFVGRIYEIIRKRINLKNEEKLLNADEIIKQELGIDFFNWICTENRKFIYGNNPICNVNNDINSDIINRCTP